MNKREFAKTIRDYRKRKKLTQEAMAEKFGLSRFSILRWEAMQNTPRKSILMFLKLKKVID